MATASTAPTDVTPALRSIAQVSLRFGSFCSTYGLSHVKHRLETMDHVEPSDGVHTAMKERKERDCLSRDLIHAAWAGDIETVRCVLAAGADVNAVDSSLDRPLHRAGKHTAVIQLLIEHGADVNAKGQCRNTPLHRAAEFGHTETAQLLIESGADINALYDYLPGEYAYTPLELAIERGHTDTAKLLIEKGADLNTHNRHHRTLLHLAARQGNYELVRLLIELGANVNVTDKYEQTPLHLVATADMARLLIARGADVNARSYDNQTPFSNAVYRAATEVAQVLIEKGADAIQDDDRGLLHFAAEQGHTGIVALLVKNGVSPDAKNCLGKKTPLHLATDGGHDDTVQQLLESGADVNARDEKGQTPLHCAAKQNHHSTVRLLIERGADVNAEDLDGRKPRVPFFPIRHRHQTAG